MDLGDGGVDGAVRPGDPHGARRGTHVRRRAVGAGNDVAANHRATRSARSAGSAVASTGSRAAAANPRTELLAAAVVAAPRTMPISAGASARAPGRRAAVQPGGAV